jgi:hypothetical protein
VGKASIRRSRKLIIDGLVPHPVGCQLRDPENITMSDHELDALLSEFSDDDLESLLRFVENIGSFEEAREALSQIREAA